jgi:uncharacterized membrane protein
MIVFAILAVAFALALLVPSRGGRRPARDAGRIAMAVTMVFAGASHFAMPEPSRYGVIYATGVLEMLLGLGLVGPTRYRSHVALVLTAYLAAVFPANVYVAVADVPVDGQPGGTYPWVRLPFQAVFIAWVLWSSPGGLALARERGDRLRRRLGAPTKNPHREVSRSGAGRVTHPDSMTQ